MFSFSCTSTCIESQVKNVCNRSKITTSIELERPRAIKLIYKLLHCLLFLKASWTWYKKKKIYTQPLNCIVIILMDYNLTISSKFYTLLIPPSRIQVTLNSSRRFSVWRAYKLIQEPIQNHIEFLCSLTLEII